MEDGSFSFKYEEQLSSRVSFKHNVIINHVCALSKDESDLTQELQLEVMEEWDYVENLSIEMHDKFVS
jgi:hypothetical protein